MVRISGTTVAAAVFCLSLIGGTVSAVTYFAKDRDLKLVEQRLDQKIREDSIMFLQKRLWLLYDRNGTRDCDQMPTWDREECRELKLKLEQLKKEDGKE